MRSSNEGVKGGHLKACGGGESEYFTHSVVWFVYVMGCEGGLFAGFAGVGACGGQCDGVGVEFLDSLSRPPLQSWREVAAENPIQGSGGGVNCGKGCFLRFAQGAAKEKAAKFGPKARFICFYGSAVEPDLDCAVFARRFGVNGAVPVAGAWWSESAIAVIQAGGRHKIAANGGDDSVKARTLRFDITVPFEGGEVANVKVDM